MTPIYLLGAGGHCRSCIDVVEAEGKYRIHGVVERRGALRTKVLGHEVVGFDDELGVLLQSVPHALVTVGQIMSPLTRIALFQAVRKAGGSFATVFSPTSHVSRHSVVGEGTIVMHGAVLNASSRVGVNCIINSLSLVEHDAVVGDHCHVSTGVRLNGGVSVGNGSFIGSGSVVREGVSIGEGCVIAMGSIVGRDVPPGTLFKNSGK